MPRPDMRAERIPQIIQAATRVFARKEFAEARMEDIALEAGLSKATLYLYFDSKDDVISAILQAFFEQGFAEMTALLESDTRVTDSLLAWTRQRAQELQENAAYLSIGFAFHAAAARNEATRQVMQRYYQDYRASLAVLIQQGIDRGEFRPADAQEIAIALISIYEGLNVLWTVDPAAIELEATAERLVRLVLAGISP